jgi:hypothetical protein
MDTAQNDCVSTVPVVTRASMPSKSLPPTVTRAAAWLRDPPRGLEIALWLVFAAVVIGIRVYLWHLLPAYFWSDDGNSYAHAAFYWLDKGEMIFDGRRGPTYTLLIAVALKVFGAVKGVIWLQHGLDALAILGIVGVARWWCGRIAVIPLFVCGIALAIYGLPLHLGHLIRNETLLFVFSAIAFSAWALALKSDRLIWFFVAALATALLAMTKNVFVAFPPVLALGVFVYAKSGWLPRLLRLAIIVAGLVLPSVALKIHNATSRHVAEPEPQAGVLFFGRTGQWTKLDGGIEPELKEVIRQDIEDYRRLPKLDNNILLKRTAVPHLWQALQARGESLTDLDRLCRRFAVEAVRDQPQAFARQVWSDLVQLHLRAGVKNEFPSDKQVIDARKSLRELQRQRDLHPAMEADAMDAILAARIEGDPFRLFHYCLNRAWLFQGFPVLFTTCALPVMLIFTRGRTRFFFLGVAAVWFSNMLLLSTVGRPLERYLMPLVPLMFWTLSGIFILAWSALLRAAGGLTSPAPSPTTGALQESQ